MDWYYDIKRYILHREYPPAISEVDKRTIRGNEFLSQWRKTLQKKSQFYATKMCRCQRGKFMEEVHEGICGTHANGHMLARKIHRAADFWLTLETDCIEYVRKCHKCQISADKITAL